MRYYRKEEFDEGEEVPFDEENNRHTSGKPGKIP